MATPEVVVVVEVVDVALAPPPPPPPPQAIKVARTKSIKRFFILLNFLTYTNGVIVNKLNQVGVASVDRKNLERRLATICYLVGN